MNEISPRRKFIAVAAGALIAPLIPFARFAQPAEANSGGPAAPADNSRQSQVTGTARKGDSVNNWRNPMESSMKSSEMGWNGKEYVLPPLPYDYAALEPHIDEATMRLHHDKHHLAYVNGLNAALSKLAASRESGDFAAVKHLSRETAFHGSGHLLHTVFWNNVTPGGGGEPSGKLAEAISESFGGFGAFMGQFKAASAAVEGSGWGLLVHEPMADRLLVMTAEKHQNLTAWGVKPLLVLDVWEHAYYLKYQNNRGAYIDAFTNVINWSDVAARLV